MDGIGCRRAFAAAALAGWAAGAAAAPGDAGARRGAAAGAAELPCPPGVASEAIAAAGGKWTYHVYLPKAYAPARKWPVLFVMGPMGGTAGTLRRYTGGAELNGWILAVSVESRNGFAQSQEAVLAMVQDVTSRLSTDPKRRYATGFSGGARMAFWLALKEKDFAGVLACGAGGAVEELSSKAAVYGLCGSNCFNRWDMACSFKGAGKNARLTFFVGNHAWADAEMVTRAMTWLNASHYGAVGTTSPASRTAVFLEEKKALMAKIAAQIDACAAADPERAYEWTLCLARADDAPETRARLQAMLQQPKVLAYAEGLKEMDRFVQKHFATSGGDYARNNGTKAALKDATELAAKYKDTSLAPIFAKMGEPSVMP
jgi:dienelactone hydrolase